MAAALGHAVAVELNLRISLSRMMESVLINCSMESMQKDGWTMAWVSVCGHWRM